MWCTIVKLWKHKILCWEARIYCGKERRHTFSAMSEAGVRSWLAEQGIPFAKQPKYPSVERGNH